MRGERLWKNELCEKLKGLIFHEEMAKEIGKSSRQCDLFKKSFSHKGNLTTRKRIHTGDKPYRCDICGESFSEGSTLITNKRINTGEKSYHCDICGE